MKTQNISLFGNWCEQVNQKFRGTRFEWLGRLICLPVFWVVFLSYCAFFWSTSMYYAMGDTYSYTTYSYNIFLGETDIMRTPVYPTLVRGILSLTGETIKLHPEVPSVTFDITSGNFSVSCIIGVQMFCFAVALYFFYYATVRIVREKTFAFWVSLFCGISLIFFQRWLSTEPLSISAVMIFYSAMIFYITSPSARNAFFIGFWAFLMVMLRPVFIYVLILLFCFWVMRLFFSEHRKTAFVGLLSLGIAIASVYGYCLLNKKNHGHFSISYIGSYNQLSRIINLGFYKSGSDPEINAYIESMNPKPGQLLSPEIYDGLCKKWSPERVDKYVKATVIQNIVPYGIACLKHMWWWGGLRFWNPCYLFGIVDFCLIVILWIVFRSIPWIRLGLWGLFYSLIVLIYINTTCDYDRLVSPGLPVIYVMVARMVDLIYCVTHDSPEEVKIYIKETL